MKTEFFMPMIPPTATAQERAVRVVRGKPYFYDTAEINAARQKLEAHMAGHRPTAPMAGPLRVIVKWLFPITGKHANGDYKDTKSDLDNLAKLLLDVMTSLCFWKDDAQIASLILEKFWTNTPGIFVKIIPIGGENSCDD